MRDQLPRPRRAVFCHVSGGGRELRESPSWGTHPIHEDLSPKGAAFLHHQMGDAVSTYESQGDRHSAARKGIFHKVPTKPDFFFLPLSFLLMWWSDSWEKIPHIKIKTL